MTNSRKIHLAILMGILISNALTAQEKTAAESPDRMQVQKAVYQAADRLQILKFLKIQAPVERRTSSGIREFTSRVSFLRKEGYQLRDLLLFLGQIEEVGGGVQVKEINLGNRDDGENIWRPSSMVVRTFHGITKPVPSGLDRLKTFLEIFERKPFKGKLWVDRLRVSPDEIHWKMHLASEDLSLVEKLSEALKTTPNAAKVSLGDMETKGGRLECAHATVQFPKERRLLEVAQRTEPRESGTAVAVLDRLTAALADKREAPRLLDLRVDEGRAEFTLEVTDDAMLMRTLERARKSFSLDGYHLSGYERTPDGVRCRVKLQIQ